MRSEAETDLYRYLLSLGFPAGAIVYEPVFKSSAGGTSFRPDFALLDPSSGVPLAIVEYKDSRQSVEKAVQQVQQYLTQLGTPGVRGYVATRGEDGFIFFQPQSGEPAKQVDPSFLSFSALTTVTTAEKKTALAREKRRTIDYFFVVCYLLAALAAALVVFDYIGTSKGVEVLTAQRLAVLAVGASLLILPFLQKFKALGIEIERQTARPDG